MRFKPLSLGLAALVAVACTDQITNPTEQANPPAPNLKVDHETFFTQHVQDYVADFGCLDEAMHIRGIIVAEKYRLWNPVQNPNRHTLSIEFKGLNEQYPHFSLEGVDSHEMWIMDLSRNNSFTAKRHDFKDGSWVYHQNINWWFVNDAGETLHVQGTYQLVRGEEGLKLYQVNRGACPEIW